MTTQWDYNKPFSMVTAVGISYFHGNTIDAQGLDDLSNFAGMDPMPEWFREFKSQTRQALEQNLEGMDVEEFDREVEPDGKTTEIFIRRMWAMIFPDEPIPGGPSEPWDTTYTLLDIYFGDRTPDHNLVHPDHLARQVQLPEREQTPLLRSIRPELTRMLHGDFDGLDLQRFRGEAAQYYLDMRRDYKDFARHVWRYLFPDETVPEA